jgi:hypothetical protein
MEKEQTFLRDSFARGIVDAVKRFEKDASFRTWMQKDKFREKLASRLADRIKQVRGNPADE